MARTQDGELLNTLQAGFKYIENESFQSTFSGLFSKINLGSDKLGKTYSSRNAKLWTIITKIAEGLAEFSTDSDTLGDAYEYLIGQSPPARARRPASSTRHSGSGTSSPLSSRLTAESRGPASGSTSPA
jgi:type I restriction enzyme M protein